MTYPKHRPDNIEVHEEQSRGWYLPKEVIELYEKEILNAEEMMLLSKLNALRNEKRGCFASNGWLADWWKKGPEWVRRTLRKFEKLRLINVVQPPGGRRQIWALIQGSPPQEKLGVTPRKVGGDPKKSWGPLTNIERLKRENMPSPSGEGATLGLGELPKLSISAKLTQKFAKFTIERRWHIGQVGSHRGGWKPATLTKWEKAMRELLSNFPKDEIKSVLRWYFFHWHDQFVPVCKTLPSFCQKYSRVRDAMIRSAKPKDSDDVGYGTEVTEDWLRRNAPMHQAKLAEPEDFTKPA